MKLYYAVQPEVKQEWEKINDPLLLHYTGSMFGIGCDARNQKAVDRINILKHRPANSGYIVLVPALEALKKYDVVMIKKIQGLISQYSPGALTVVLPCDHPRLKHLQLNGKIAFRIPEDELLRHFLSLTDIPLISTSINLAGKSPEWDYTRIITAYRDWFDLGIVPENELIAENVPSTVVTLDNDRLVCLREGQLEFSQLEQDFYHPLLTFVCTGNICRSPLAEYYFRQQAEKFNLNWRSTSAGFIESGIKISENSRILLERDDIDANAHVSTQLDKELIKRSRIILTMTANHKNNLVNTGWKSDHIFTLARFIGKQHDIEDPYQESLEVYQQAYQQIKYYIDLLIKKLLQEQQ